MTQIKNFVATMLFAGVCFFSVSVVLAQDQTGSQTAERQLSEVKGKRLIFVDVANESTKRRIEEFFRTTQFQPVQNRKDAELIYSAAIQVESKPSFGTVENRSTLPKLASGERSTGFEQNNDAEFPKHQYEYRRKTSASVYVEEPSGHRAMLWSKETLRITQSKESGSILEYLRKSGDELALAKHFVKAVKNLK